MYLVIELNILGNTISGYKSFINTMKNMISKRTQAKGVTVVGHQRFVKSALKSLLKYGWILKS